MKFGHVDLIEKKRRQSIQRQFHAVISSIQRIVRLRYGKEYNE